LEQCVKLLEHCRVRTIAAACLVAAPVAAAFGWSVPEAFSVMAGHGM
jgi:hypothetical protein